MAENEDVPITEPVGDELPDEQTATLPDPALPDPAPLEEETASGPAESPQAAAGELPPPLGPGEYEQLVLDGMPAPQPGSAGPVTLASVWRTPLHWPKRRTVVATLLAAVLVAAGGAGAYRLGTEHAALGPTVLATPAPGASVAQSVYAAESSSVVTLSVPGGGSGSGFFYRPGRILTNYHVLATSSKASAALAAGQSTTVEVILADGRKRTGTVKLVDARLDLAIVEVDPTLDVRPLAFADTAHLTPGQPVVVIGAPFGLLSSVTSGVLSGTDRATVFAEDPVQSLMLQTDAAVNPGNSGGPLLDANGRVLGMVTLRPDSADGRSVSGEAFAIPSALLLDAVNQLERFGGVSHPMIGITLRDATADDHATGAVVQAVTPGSAADAAHLQAADVVTAIDGQAVTGHADVVRDVAAHRAGDTIAVALLRHGQPLTAQLTLKERATS